MIRCSRNSSSDTKGFTMIELMLAMAFIGMLLIVIASTSMFMMRAYTKGATIREVNQAGRTIIDDIQRTVSASSPVKVSPVRESLSDSADSKYVEKKDLGGRLCLGNYSYVWNYGAALAVGDIYNQYSDSSSDIRFAKVRDIGGNLCIDMEGQIEESQATELLASGDRDLVIHSIKVEEGSRQDVARQAMYSIRMIIGTNSMDQIDSSSTCKPPSDDTGSGSDDFCAVNHFDIIVRAGSSPGSSQ